jgi:hypothetical protein
LKYDFGNPEQLELICSKLKTKITPKTRLYFNPLSLMLKSADVPQEEIGEVDFMIHHNYAGHPEFESSMAIEVVAGDEDTYNFLENLAELRSSEPDHQLNLEEIDWNQNKKLIQIIKVLIYQGFLVVDVV